MGKREWLVLDPRIVLQEAKRQRADSYSWFLRWFLAWVGVLGLGGWGGVTFYLQEQGESSSWPASFPEKALVRQTQSLGGGGVEEGKGSVRGRRQSCADHIGFFTATLHPLGPVVRHRQAFWKNSAFFSLTRHTFLPPAGTAAAQTLILSFAECQGEQGPHMFTKEVVQNCSELWLARRLQSGLSPG